MPRIPEYTTTVIRERAVADTFDMGAISRAGEMFSGASQAFGVASDIALKFERANEATAVNEAVIAKQRENIDYLEQVKQQRQGNPSNAAADVEKDLKKRDQEIAETLPSRRAKQAFMNSASRINLQEYGNMVNWENTRKAQIYAGRIQNAISDNNILMLRAGREGLPIDDYLRNVDATTVAATGVFAPEKLTQINQSGRAEGLSYYLQGVAERNPSEAKRLLDSKKYDDDLGAGGLQQLYRVVDAEQKRVQAQAQADIKQEARAIEDAAKLGLTVQDDVIRSLATKAESAGLSPVAQSLNMYADNQVKARDFAGLSMADEVSQLKEIAKDIEGGNLERVAEYDVLSNVFQNKQKMISEGRGWEFYSAHNIVREPEPMNMADPESVSASISQRRGDMQRIQDLEGFSIAPLTANEIAMLKDTYQTGRAGEVSTVLAGLTGALEPDERRALSQQLEMAKAPILAAAMGQPMEVAEGIIAGSKLPDVASGTDMNGTINEKLTGYVYDAEAYVGASQAIKSYYKHLSLLEGDSGQSVDRKRMERAIEEVLGRPAEISVNGRPSKVILYRGEDQQFVRPAHVENIFENMTLDSVSSDGSYPVSSDGSPVDLSEVNQTATFITVGDGKYIAEFPGLGMLLDSKGGPFVFDTRQIEQRLGGLTPKISVPKRGTVVSPTIDRKARELIEDTVGVMQ